MDKTCSNCKNWSQLYSNRNGARCDVTEQAFTMPDMTCPRHEAKIEFPKWTPEFHPASETPKFGGGNLILFCNQPSSLPAAVRGWHTGNEWYSPDSYWTHGVTEVLFWCYLPGGWE